MSCSHRWFVAALLPLLLAGSFSAGAAFTYEPVVWTSDVGGPRKSVHQFAQSPDGFLWLRNEETLSRFDGREFQSMETAELPGGAAPAALWADRAGMHMTGAGGTVWTWRDGTFAGVMTLQPGTSRTALVWSTADGAVMVLKNSGRRWQCVPGKEAVELPGELHPVDGPATGMDDGSAWWRTTAGGLVRGESHGAASVMPLPEQAGGVTDLAAGSASEIWIGTEQALLRWLGGEIESWPAPPGETGWRVQWFRRGWGEEIWMEANDALWVLQNNQWRKVPADWPPPAAVRSMAVDAAGNFWFADRSGKIAAVQPDGAVLDIDGIHELRGGNVDALFGDREGNVWAGIQRVGLVQFKRQRFRSLTLKDGLPAPMIWTVCEDGSGAIWFAGEAPFLGRWKDGGLSLLERDHGDLPGAPSALLCDKDGRLVTGFDNTGIFLRYGERFLPERPRFRPAMQGQVHFLFDDREGRRWVGLSGGVAVAGEGSAQFYGSRAFGGSALRTIAQDAAGRIWIGTASNGMAWFEDEKFHPVTTANGLPHNTVYALCGSADGSLWAGTVGGGLARYRSGKITVFNVSHGLPDDRVMSLVEDGAGFLWAGTRAGLARISLTSLAAVEHDGAAALDLVVFDRSDGLPTREFSGGKQPSVWKARDGRLWFPTTGGLASCHPDELQLNRLPPQPQILAVSLDGNRATAADHPFDVMKLGPRALEVPPGPHSLEVRWIAPSMISGDRMRYSYWMEGVDRDWSGLTGQTGATWGTLAPGSYRLLVRACNHDGTWSERPAELAITVHPEWWQRTSVRAGGAGLGALLLSAMVFGIMRARHRRAAVQAEMLRVKERERARIARDLHDDLGASLTEISMLATAVPGAAPPPEAVQGRLSVISGKARSLVEALDEIVWAVNPRHDTAGSLAAYLTGYAREFLGASNIACSFDVPPSLPDLKLEAGARHNLFVAFKEVLHNIVRHSGATQVSVRLHIRAGHLEVQVEDNGCGMQNAGGGDGLGNLQERMKAAGGQCFVESRDGATGVRLCLPAGMATSDA